MRFFSLKQKSKEEKIVSLKFHEKKEEEFTKIKFSLITGTDLTISYTQENYEKYIDLMNSNFPIFFRFNNGIVRKSSIISITKE